MGVPTEQAEATFALQGEDHTMGNALRYMLNKNPHVSFAVSSDFLFPPDGCALMREAPAVLHRVPTPR